MFYLWNLKILSGFIGLRSRRASVSNGNYRRNLVPGKENSFSVFKNLFLIMTLINFNGFLVHLDNFWSVIISGKKVTVSHCCKLVWTSDNLSELCLNNSSWFKNVCKLLCSGLYIWSFVFYIFIMIFSPLYELHHVVIWYDITFQSLTEIKKILNDIFLRHCNRNIYILL